MSDQYEREAGRLLMPDHYLPSKTNRRSMSLGLAVGVTLLGTIVPGVGLLVAKRRRLGIIALSIFTVLLGVAIYLAVAGQRALLHWSVEPEPLLWIGWLLPTIGAGWVLVTIGTYWSLGRDSLSTRQRVVGGAVAVLMACTVFAPFLIGGRYALIQRGLIEHVFAAPSAKSATVPTGVQAAGGGHGPSTSVVPHRAWQGRDRVNILLLGGDGGSDRIGIRTDTVILASVDTHTGNTVLFSLPRNLQKIPFEPGSILAKTYRNGTFAGKGNELEWMLTAIYRNVPEAHPGLLKSDNPGADAVKMAVSGALGLHVDYYALVNLKGFEKVIDALGGVTVNVNQRVAIGGEASANLKPWGYIEKGPNQHMDGWTALWFARGRYGASDWDRMLRQRCVIKAVIDQADPGRVLTRYEAIAQSSKDVVYTDIPADLLPDLVDLALKVKQGSVTNIAFTNDVINVNHPDYNRIHSMVQAALKASVDNTTPPPATDSLDKVCAYHG